MVPERPTVRLLTDGDEPTAVVVDLLAVNGHPSAIHQMIESTRIDHVLVESLVLAGSPRSAGQDPHHIRQLLEATGPLPPIVVHRPTMRVVDGFHRVQVARQLGTREIAARFFDSDDEAAFLLGVTLNIRHGLPLARSDRQVAADQLLYDHPEWSNRMIGSVVGLSDKTIAARRKKSTAEIPQLTRRIGRDGRSRPITSYQQSQPTRSRQHNGQPHREVGDLHLCSEQREELAQCDRSPRVEARIPATDSQDTSLAARLPDDSTIEQLKSDPSIRQTEAGRAVLRALMMPVGAVPIDERLADALPTHALGTVASLAERRAKDLLAFATRLRRRRTHANGRTMK